MKLKTEEVLRKSHHQPSFPPFESGETPSTFVAQPENFALRNVGKPVLSAPLLARDHPTGGMPFSDQIQNT
eukprot:s562_g7.t1